MSYRNIFRKTILCTIVLVGCRTSAIADITIDWQDTSEALSRLVLEKSNIVSDFAALIDKHFISTAEHSLKEIQVTINNEDSPRVSVDSTELMVPYHYLAYAIKSHAKLEETREAALDRAINTVEYTLYHLFGHLIAKDNQSDADDIAEAVSSWLMIKGFANGGEQWFADADAFGRASQLLDGPLKDYWHEHSLYKSRQKTINCWILGSDPARYESLLKAVLEPEKRTHSCIAEWNKLDSEMQSLLKDNIKPDSSLIAH